MVGRDDPYKRCLHLSGPQFTIAQCFCGDENAEYSKYGSSTDCVYPCAGTDNELCGGSFAIQVRDTGQVFFSYAVAGAAGRVHARQA